MISSKVTGSQGQTGCVSYALIALLGVPGRTLYTIELSRILPLLSVYSRVCQYYSVVVTSQAFTLHESKPLYYVDFNVILQFDLSSSITHRVYHTFN